MQRFTSRAVWDCPLCSHTNAQDIIVPELNFSAEDSSDLATDGWAEIVCEGCNRIFTGSVYVDPGHTSFEIDDPCSVSFTGDPPMYEPEYDDDYEPPEDPYSIVIEALDQLKEMVGKPGPSNDIQFINRLVFAGAISSLEAYLGDTLINAVQDDDEIRKNLLKNNKDLGNISVTAAQLAEDHEVVAKRITSELRGYLYHNLRIVNVLYKDAFGISIMPSKDVSDILFKAMPLRHDCVHRNGSTQKGEKRSDFTDEYVVTVINNIKGVVEHIEFRNDVDLSF